MAATIANAHRDEKKRPQPFSEFDFIPDFDARAKQAENERVQKPLSVKERAKRMAVAFQIAFSGRIKKKSNAGSD